MAFSFTNNNATISTTEFFLASNSITKVDQTDDCILQLWIDPVAMVSLNQIQIKIIEKVTSAGTQRTIVDATLTGLTSYPWVSPALILKEAWEASLLIASGADVAMGWSLRKVTGGLTFSDNSATIGTTEFFLASNSTTQTAQTTDCLLQTWIDFGAMTATEQYRVRLYEKVNGSGATQRRVFESILTGTQAGPFVHPLFLVGEGWDVGVTKLAGTDRSILWSLRKGA